MNKSFALAEVKTVDGSKAPGGEFEAILSAPTLDRDGEVIEAEAFAKHEMGLPPSVPVHAYHDFSDPIGRGVPEYRDGTLYIKGFFASTPRAQEIRTLVAEGVIAHMSVGFMPPERKDVDGVTHITAAELLEGSFVSIPSNREAAVLAVKGYSSEIGELRQAVTVLTKALEQFAAPNSGSSDDDKAADDGPEVKAAAPAAADPPAQTSVGMAHLAAMRAQAELLLID